MLRWKKLSQRTLSLVFEHKSQEFSKNALSRTVLPSRGAACCSLQPSNDAFACWCCGTMLVEIAFRPAKRDNSFFSEDAHELAGGMGEARAAPRNEVNVPRHIQLPHLYFLHPAAFDFPMNTHARDDGDAHAHLHEAFDAFDGGHFDGHVERGAVSGKQFNDAAAKRRLDAVSDEVFFAKLGDIDFAFFCEDMLGVDDQCQLIFADFRSQKLGITRHKRDSAEIEAV